MPITDQVKNLARKLIESRPSAEELSKLVRARKPLLRRFCDDGTVPNHPRWPLIIYRAPVALSRSGFEPAAVLDALFSQNGWGRSWRNGIYDFTHYHSQTHEVLGVASGQAKIELGGARGKIYSLKHGDVAILPAGTGHRLIDGSSDLLVVGAYPSSGVYDEITDSRHRTSALDKIARVPMPEVDPVYGPAGGLLQHWKR
jgi:uncharacterized protein YjlB